MGLALCVSSHVAWTQAVPSETLFGTVRTSTGAPLRGVEVWIDGTSFRVVTSDAGEFRFDGLPIGRATVKARRAGFKPASRRVTLRPGTATEVLITLAGTPLALEKVVVTTQLDSTVRLREFWERRNRGLGVFITRGEIERRRAQHSSDLFRGVTGIQVITGGGSSTKLVTTRRAASPARLRTTPGAECPMQYYVDGIFMSAEMFSIDELAPDMIEAIEIFRGPSEVPAQFKQTDVDCGLVLIWTREPPKPAKRER